MNDALRVSLGDGGNPALQRAIRAHANFSEYVPFALVMLAILELSRFSIYALHALGMLLTRRLHREGALPIGFVANDYALAVWGIGDIAALMDAGRLDLDRLFDEDMLGDDLEAWLAESALMKRTFL